MKIERILRINSPEVYELEIMFDEIQFNDLHAFVWNSNKLIADFYLDGYVLTVEKRSNSSYCKTIYYKLEREVIQ